MRMPRFTVRRLMILVAAVAVPLGIALTRQARFSREAAYHRSQSLKFRMFLLHDEYNTRLRIYDSNRNEIPADRARRIIEVNSWHHALARKYEQAAAQPWLIVAPDPPEPE